MHLTIAMRIVHDYAHVFYVWHVWSFINKPQKGDIFGAPTVMHTTTTSNVLGMLIETTHNSQGSNLWTFGSDPTPQMVA